MCRFVHFTDVTPTHGPWLNAFEQGQSQAMLAQISYHYLRAAATGAFDVREHPGDVSIGQLFPRQSVHFERYAAYPLEPFVGLKLLRSKYHAEDLEVYREDVMIDWKTRAGGILYAVWAGSSFWNMMLCFQSRMRTTGIQAWDTLLAQWEASGFQKCLLPCMTFAHVTGCLDPECPFMHNERVARADREVVLAYRRAECGRLTAEDVARYHEGQAAELSPVDDGLLVERIRRHILHPDVPICWNVECHTLDHLRCGKIILKDCERCTIASYCSDLCQHMNWERHQPGCYPLARIIEDDELWLPMGARIGTDRNGIVFSREGVMVPGCSPRLLSPSSRATPS